MGMSEAEHSRHSFERIQAAIDAESVRIAQEQPGLDIKRVKLNVRKIMAEYQRSEELATMDSDQEFWDGLQEFFSESYPRDEPKAEFEATHEFHGRVMKCLGWGQIGDMGGPEDDES